MILARLLTPADFGIMAMVLPLAQLTNTIGFRGLQTTVIHQEHLDAARTSAFFRTSSTWNLLLAAAMAGLGPAVARFYDEPRVLWITVAWAAVIYVATLSAVHTGLLKRQMRFGAVTAIQLGSAAIGVAAAIGAALAGAAYWALLIQLAAWRASSTVLTWIVCDWRPALRPAPGSPVDGRGGFHAYWAGLSGYRLVSWVGDQADRVLTGVLGGATPLGLYQISRRWAWYPVSELSTALSDVAVAGLSRVRDDARYAGYLRRALLPVFTLALPATAFIFVEAESVILVLLGDQWLGAVVYLRLMSVAAFLGGLRQVTEWIYLSRGDTARQLRWSLIATPIMLATVAMGGVWAGPVGVAAGFTAGTCLLAVPSVWYAVRPSDLSTGRVLRPLLRPALCSILAGALLTGSSLWLAPLHPVGIDLAVRLALFGVLFVGFWLAPPGGTRARRDIRDAIAALRGSG